MAWAGRRAHQGGAAQPTEMPLACPVSCSWGYTSDREEVETAGSLQGRVGNG